MIILFKILSFFYFSIVFLVSATQSLVPNLTIYIFLAVFNEYIPELPQIPTALPHETLLLREIPIL